MKKKKWALAVSLMLAANPIKADLVIMDTDGTSGSVPVADVQRITFENGLMITLLKDGTVRTTPVEKVRKCYFGTAEGGVTGIATASTDELSLKGNTVTVRGKAGTPLSIATADGKTVVRRTLDGTASTISLEGWATGVYIVTVNNHSIKLLKK